MLKIINERIACLERKIQQLPPEILEDCGPEEKATKFFGQQDSWKGNNLYFTEHGGKRCCQPQRSILLRYKNERKRKNKIKKKNIQCNLCSYDVQKASSRTPKRK